MTNRQRFQKVMSFEHTDRLPYFEEIIRNQVLECWQQQGLQSKNAFKKLYPTDSMQEFILNIDPLPELKKWPKSIIELDSLRTRLDADDPARLPVIWKNKIKASHKNDEVVFLRVNRGLFLSMGIYDWQRFADVLTWLNEYPQFVEETMKIQGEFSARLVQNVLAEIEIDCAIFNEPIGGNEGPLISPDMYEKYALDSYRPLLDVLAKHAVKTIIFRSYANTRILIPRILKYGINCLWASETNNPAMDYRDIRQEFGRDLRLIGGIDLDALRKDKLTIRREIEDKVPELIASGGYLPMTDGRIRKDIPFANYAYYRDLLDKTLRSNPV